MSIDQQLRDTAQQLRAADPDQPELARTWHELMLTAESRSHTRRLRRLVAVPVLALALLVVLSVTVGPNLLPDRSAPPGENSPTTSASPSPSVTPTPTPTATNQKKSTPTVHDFPRTQLTPADWPSMRADMIQLDPHELALAKRACSAEEVTATGSAGRATRQTSATSTTATNRSRQADKATSHGRFDAVRSHRDRSLRLPSRRPHPDPLAQPARPPLLPTTPSPTSGSDDPTPTSRATRSLPTSAVSRVLPLRRDSDRSWI